MTFDDFFIKSKSVTIERRPGFLSGRISVINYFRHKLLESLDDLNFIDKINSIDGIIDVKQFN